MAKPFKKPRKVARGFLNHFKKRGEVKKFHGGFRGFKVSQLRRAVREERGRRAARE